MNRDEKYLIAHKIAKIPLGPHAPEDCKACRFLSNPLSFKIATVTKGGTNVAASNMYSITEHGWLTRIQKDIKSHQTCIIKAEGTDALNIITMIQNSIESIPQALFPDTYKKMKEEWKILFLKSDRMFISPEMMILIFGSIGGLGGAFISVGYCIGLAHHEHMQISIEAHDKAFYFTFEKK